MSSYSANLETYRAQHPSLLPEFWIPLARYYDDQMSTITDGIFPAKTFPRSHFKWRIFTDPAAMAPYTNEGAKTPMVTQRATYEEYETRFLKVGFYVTQRELDEGLPNVIQRSTQQCINMIKRRIEFVNINAMQGLTWNAVSTARMTNLARASWQASGGTPIADVLIAMLRVWKRCGVRPDTIYMGPDEHMFLQNHATITAYLGLGSGIRGEADLLCKDMIYCIKSLNIKVVDSLYKEEPWSYALWQAGTPFPRAPGLGDMAFDSSTNPDKHWMLLDRAIITAGKLGFTAHSKSPSYHNEQWRDPDTGNIYHKFEDEFCPVVEDYGRIALITFTGTTRGTDYHPTQL